MAGTLMEKAEEVLGGSVLEPTSGYRKAIGVLGVALPPVLVFWPKAESIQASISGYYSTGMRDWFVGTLWVIGVFLFFYQYRPKLIGEAKSTLPSVKTGRADAYLGKIAGVAAVCVALFPTAPPPGSSLAPPRIGMAHGIAAAVLFLCLSLFPLWLFKQSRERTALYNLCGIVMLLSLALIAAYTRAPESVRASLAPRRPILVLEWILIWGFGISWFAKGMKPKADAAPVPLSARSALAGSGTLPERPR